MCVGNTCAASPWCSPSVELLRHQRPNPAVGCKHIVIAGEIDSWPGYQGSEAGDEIQRFKQDVGGAIAVLTTDADSDINRTGGWPRVVASLKRGK